jgi:hypothetical protein
MIKVRGGLMYAYQKGIIDIIYKDKSSYYLKDILFVLGLGVNLLSAR